MLAHESPAWGCGAHVPHSAPVARPQKPDVHCAAKLQEPVCGPCCVVQAVGGTLLKKSVQLSAPIAALHARIAVGLFPVIGAASASTQVNLSRATQVARSPKRRARSDAEQL